MLLIGFIALLFAIGCAALVLVPFYLSRRDSQLYRWIWSAYLILSLCIIGLFTAQWKYDSANQEATSNWGTSEGPLSVLGDLSTDLFQLTVFFATTILVILFLVSGWGHPKRLLRNKHGANKPEISSPITSRVD
ncbi:MAG: hypothetical protein P1U68_08245 [Verrucomicrobiales bacterium]|nr:hypothetical protein [Verrucomicrobiales bacterium]